MLELALTLSIVANIFTLIASIMSQRQLELWKVEAERLQKELDKSK